MACSSTETPPKSFQVIPEDETDPEKIATLTTDFMFELAREESIAFIEEDDDLKTMIDEQKKIVIKLMCDRIVDKYMLRFKRELYKNMENEKAAEDKTIHIDLSCNCDEKNKE